MTIAFTRTRNQIAQLALGKLVQLGSTTPVTADSDLVYEAIDLQLKSIHRLGTFWRNVSPLPVTFTVSAISASVSADILFPIQMMIQNGLNYDPVRIVDKREYSAIENKTQGGIPTKAIWEGGAKFTVWPVPTSSLTATLTYESIADDTSASAETDVDVAMIASLVDIVVYELVDNFGIPEGKIPRLEKKALKGERTIRALNQQRVDYGPVAVDDFDNSQPGSRIATDYNL